MNLQESETKTVSLINKYTSDEAKTERGSCLISGTITDPNGAVIPNASVVQPNYEFYDRLPQFLSENQRFPIFGLRLEF